MTRIRSPHAHSRSSRIAAALVAVLALAGGIAQAAPVSYSEVIEDLNLGQRTRDLRRTTTLGNGNVLIENDDTIIASDTQNDLSNNFGLNSAGIVTWTHRLTYLPPVETFLFGQISITVSGADPSNAGFKNDLVFLESFFFPLIFLTPGTDNDPITTSSLATSNSTILSNYLTDGMLTVLLFPLGSADGLFDSIEIISSRVDLRYEPKGFDVVPEPSTMALMLGGLGLAVARARRRTRV